MQHIMVIDDDAKTLLFLEDLLVDHGYRVTTWATSLHAIEQLEQEQPDLLVLDNHLGYPSSGWGILQELRVNDETAGLPVILCSGDLVFLDAKEKWIRGMGADILPKPISAQELISMIERMLDDIPPKE